MKPFYIGIFCLLFSAGASAEGISAYLANALNQVERMNQRQEHEQALAFLESVTVSRGSDQAQLARWLGVLYWQQGRNQQAIASLEQSLATQGLPQSQTREVQRMLADLHLLEAQYQTSLDYYYLLVEGEVDAKHRQQLWQRIAQAHYYQQQWQATIKAAQHALIEQSENPASTLQLKLGAEIALQRWQSAITTLNQLIELQPQQPMWWRQLSSVYLKVGDISSALNTLSLAKLNHVKLDPSDLRLLAQLYAKRGLPELAAKQMAELEQSDTSVHSLIQQANYWQWAKEWQKAEQVWLEIASQDPKYYWQVAQLQIQSKQYPQALESLEKIPDTSAKVMLAKANIHYKLGQLPQAVKSAQSAVELDSTKEAQQWLDFLRDRQALIKSR